MSNVTPLNAMLADDLEIIVMLIRDGKLAATHGVVVLDVPTDETVFVRPVGLPARPSERLGLLSFASLEIFERMAEES